VREIVELLLETELDVEVLARPTPAKEDELLVIASEDEEATGAGVEVLIEMTTTDDELSTDVESNDVPQILASHDTVCCIIEIPDIDVGKLGIGIVGQMEADMTTIASEQCACSELEEQNRGSDRGICQSYLLE